MKSELIDYVDGEETLEGFLCFDESAGAKPTVLIVHDWSGCREFVQEKTQYFANKGYTAFAVDMYGKGKRGSSTDNTINQTLMTPFVEDRGLIVQRLNAALRKAKTLSQVDANNIAVIGFCFGGMCALDLARVGADIKGAVSIHGLLFPPEGQSEDKIQAKILVLHGHEDKLAPPEQVQAFTQEMTDRDADWQIHLYGKTLHAFTNPEANSPEFDPNGSPPSFGVKYSATADQRAWKAIGTFFVEIFSAT